MDEAEFDRFADEYHHQHAANIRASGEEPEFFAKYKIDDVSAALRHLGRKPARILDFGGGVGNSVGFMREAFAGSESSCSIRRRKRWTWRAGAIRGARPFSNSTAGRIPFPDKSFDLVFVACVFHHIPADLHVPLLREIDRVLANGGSLFVFEHNPSTR